MTTKEQVIHDAAQRILDNLRRDFDEAVVRAAARNIQAILDPSKKPFELFINAGDTYSDAEVAINNAPTWAVFGINFDGEELTVRKVHDGRTE